MHKPQKTEDRFLTRIKTFAAENGFMRPESKVLLAVSGGIDSMVMAHVLHKMGLAHGIAYCNFQLRGKESDEDEIFVKDWAEKNKIPFHTKRFETKYYALTKGISIQMAARELRYTWFTELCNTLGYNLVAMAHHLDDQAETFFINLARASGIKGLVGMPVRQGIFIRPLLCTTRKEIEEYARQNRIAWREDSSNPTEKYLRNKIRHRLLPMFESIYPGATENLLDAMKKLRNCLEIYSHRLDEFVRNVTYSDHGMICIKISELNHWPDARNLITEYLASFHFHAETIRSILTSLNTQPGKTFYSSTHRLTKDRDCFYIEEIREETEEEFIINEGTKTIAFPVNLRIIDLPKPKEYRLPDSPYVASLDYDKVHFPLVLRKWKTGDVFYPLGMKGKKKISDFFTDHKIPLPLKKKVWLLTSEGEILWVLGYRIDHRYRITEKTKNILYIEYYTPES